MMLAANPDPGAFSFSRRTRKILEHLAHSAMPAGRIVGGPGEPTLSRLETFFGQQPRVAGAGMGVLIQVLDQGARLQFGRPFTSLSGGEKLDYMRGLLNGPYAAKQLLRTVLSPLKVARFDDDGIHQDLECRYAADPVTRTEQPPRYMERAMDARECITLEDEELEADVVVVGSGAGGAAMAAELAEMGIATVMLEEGGFHHRDEFNGRPVEMLTRLYRDRGATVTVGNCVIPVPMGRCVGGTTTINSGTCYRPPDRILERWQREMGLTDLTEAELDPSFSKVENVLQVTPAEPKYVGGVGDVVARGCDQLGWRHHGPLDRNAPDCDGQSICVFGCPTDAKRSTNVSYVPLALRYGANLIYKARMERLLFDGGRAAGVVARASGGRRFLIRARAVVLAAGTLMTPTLLLRQGLQNSHGQVGRHLSIHPAVGAMALFDQLIDGSRSIPQGYGVEEFHEEGLLFEGAFLPLDLGAGGVTLVGPQFTEVMEKYRQMTFFGFLVEDTSRGRVRLGPGGLPLMTYWLNRNDVARLKRGMELLFQIYLAGGAKAIYPMVPGFEEVRDMRDVERFRRARLGARDFELTAHHPLCSCRMGRDPRSSVVGQDNQAHHVPGLFVADGSSLPSSPGVNPQVTIMALATRAARYVAREVE